MSDYSPMCSSISKNVSRHFRAARLREELQVIRSVQHVTNSRLLNLSNVNYYKDFRPTVKNQRQMALDNNEHYQTKRENDNALRRVLFRKSSFITIILFATPLISLLMTVPCIAGGKGKGKWKVTK